MDWPQATTPAFISSHSRWGIYSGANLFAVAEPGSLTPGAGGAWYTPLLLPWPYVMRRMWHVVGGTVTGNVDLGIYSVEGTLIWSSGNVALGTTGIAQYVTPSAPVLLPAGRYYLAISASSTGQTRGFTAIGANQSRCAGILRQTSGANPLPATATFAAPSTSAPLLGITSYASGF